MNVRAPRPVDLPAVLALVRAADAAVYGDSDWTEADLREEWEELELERDAWLVELDGRLGGYATFIDRGDGRLMGDGYVHPDLRGQGIGSRLLELTEARARRQIAALATGAVRLETASLAGDPGAPRLFAGRGYQPVRHFFRMVAELVDEPPLASPPGIQTARFVDEDAQAVHAAIGEAFADEWDFRPETFADWRARRLERDRARPDLWWVARDGDELVAAIICDWKRNGDWGWVGALGVRPAWRRRGIGEALLRAAFAEFKRLGERQVALGVDSQNPTGATRLYERAGMRVLWQADVYRKELRGG